MKGEMEFAKHLRPLETFLKGIKKTVSREVYRKNIQNTIGVLLVHCHDTDEAYGVLKDARQHLIEVEKGLNKQRDI